MLLASSGKSTGAPVEGPAPSMCDCQEDNASAIRLEPNRKRKTSKQESSDATPFAHDWPTRGRLFEDALFAPEVDAGLESRCELTRRASTMHNNGNWGGLGSGERASMATRGSKLGRAGFIHALASAFVLMLALGAGRAWAGAPSIRPGATSPGLTHDKLEAVEAELRPRIAAGLKLDATRAMLEEKLGKPVEGGSGDLGRGIWPIWAVTDATRCTSLELSRIGMGEEAVAQLTLSTHQVAKESQYYSDLFKCVDDAHRDPRGTAWDALRASERSSGSIGDNRRLISRGMFALIALGIGFIVWRHRSARNVWSAFGAAHGLSVSGLEVGGSPRITGRYRGVEIEVGLRILRRTRRYVFADTMVVARLDTPLPEGTWISAEDGEGGTAHRLLANPVVAEFLRTNRHAAVADAGVTATIEAMPADVATLQRVVDACVQCAQAIDAEATDPRQPV
jgi:hypothetical protein